MFKMMWFEIISILASFHRLTDTFTLNGVLSFDFFCCLNENENWLVGEEFPCELIGELSTCVPFCVPFILLMRYSLMCRGIYESFWE